ncbi:transmembrane protease serine 9 [Stegastes partitus]|uniref:trypsin n=3 Tax=Stegastes partitus TaxID=144197 RepID=A0A9Y4NKC6_9TELE|nr:PREDICTED: complement factor D [Stegastes partitus]
MHVLHKVLLLLVLTCLKQNAFGSEIINGKKAKKKSMQYMASVQNNEGHVCGGFLVSEDFVMTAAHCDEKNPTSVVLGTNNLKMVDSNTMRYSIKKCKHPNYTGVASGNDIMLLKLSRKARLGKNGKIKPIEIPSHQTKLKKHQKCTVAGWGATETYGLTVDELQVVNVPFINLETCQEAWRGQLPATAICAGGYDTKQGFCQGDSGGPLVCNGKLAVGIASFNNNNTCDYPDVPNVYTDIAKFLPWIQDILKKKQCYIQQAEFPAKMMQALHILTLLYALTCLGQNAHGGEIINGKKVPNDLMLFMASVQSSDGHVCGGFLVSEDFVVTAAHCDKANPTSVVLGTHNLKKINNATMRYSVSRCKYPQFKDSKFGDDIMLLKLSKKAQLNNRVQPIRLPKGENKLRDKAKCRVAGWGRTKTGGESVNDLQEVDVPVVNLEECKRKWRVMGRKLPKNVTCTGGSGIKKGFCKGDSGGPLVCGGMAVGVVSFNLNCDYPNLPNVYTDTSKYLQWINKILKQKHCKT